MGLVVSSSFVYVYGCLQNFHVWVQMLKKVSCMGTAGYKSFICNYRCFQKLRVYEYGFLHLFLYLQVIICCYRRAWPDLHPIMQSVKPSDTQVPRFPNRYSYCARSVCVLTALYVCVGVRTTEPQKQKTQ